MSSRFRYRKPRRGSGSGDSTIRPYKLTPEVRQRLLDALRKGSTRKAAAESAGIGYSTFRGWLAAGRSEPEAGLSALLADIKRAEAEAVVAAVDIIGKAAAGGAWQAAAWWLERRYPEDWGQQRDTIRQLVRLNKELLDRLAVGGTANPQEKPRGSVSEDGRFCR
jgi:hypothetical protein